MTGYRTRSIPSGVRPFRQWWVDMSPHIDPRERIRVRAILWRLYLDTYPAAIRRLLTPCSTEDDQSQESDGDAAEAAQLATEAHAANASIRHDGASAAAVGILRAFAGELRLLQTRSQRRQCRDRWSEKLIGDPRLTPPVIDIAMDTIRRAVDDFDFVSPENEARS